MTEDDYVRNVVGALRRVGARALDVVDSEGRYYLRRCAKCAFRIRHWSYKQKSWVCGKCGAPWPYRDRYLLKGAVQRSPRPGAAEEHATSIASKHRLVQLLRDFVADEHWKFEARAYVACATEWSRRDVAEAGPELMPDFPHAWTEDRVRGLVRRGRREWGRRLREAGYPVASDPGRR